MRTIWLLTFLITLSVTGCTNKRDSEPWFKPPELLDKGTDYRAKKVLPLNPYKQNGHLYTPAYPNRKSFSVKASWYGTAFHGKPTATGEIFDLYKYSAAHKTLPIPSFAKVTNPENGKSIILRINDRGPFIQGRDLDLSWAAARRLGVVKKGVSSLDLVWLGVEPPGFFTWLLS